MKHLLRKGTCFTNKFGSIWKLRGYIDGYVMFRLVDSTNTLTDIVNFIKISDLEQYIADNIWWIIKKDK